MPWLFLSVAVLSALFALNIHWPPKKNTILSGLGFFAGWLTGELAVHVMFVSFAVTATFFELGALEAWPGFVGTGFMVVSWGLLWWSHARSRKAETAVDAALLEAFGQGYRDSIPQDAGSRTAPALRRLDLAFPFRIRHPDVERIRDIVYTEGPGYRVKLDVYRKRGLAGPRPTLLMIHGGAWVLGSKDQQGLPLAVHLASRGWVCVNANYRLSPRATFPDALIDLKHAVAWIREHGTEYGADPDFIVVTGGSAGGHLAALVALTPNDAEYQPGFEDVDTSVRGCVPFYGVYDFTDRHGDWPNRGLSRILERSVMKAKLSDAREAYEKASPMSRVHADAPPFFVVHGDTDTLVPVSQARQFVSLLRGKTQSQIAYAEIPGGQHAFEVFPSLRSMMVVHGVERFLDLLYAQYLGGRDQKPEHRIVAHRANAFVESEPETAREGAELANAEKRN